MSAAILREKTKKLILSTVRSYPSGLHIAEISRKAELYPRTVRKYLLVMETENLVKSRLVGTAKVYRAVIPLRGKPKPTEDKPESRIRESNEQEREQ